MKPGGANEEEALVALLQQVKELAAELRSVGADAGSDEVHLSPAEAAALEDGLARLRIGLPPPHLAPEVAALWQRFSAAWAAPGPAAELRAALIELCQPIAGHQEEAGRLKEQIDLMTTRLGALRALDALLDELLASGASSAGKESDG